MVGDTALVKLLSGSAKLPCDNFTALVSFILMNTGIAKLSGLTAVNPPASVVLR